MFIYLDESGDLGFDFGKQKTTKKFVITLLVCHSHNTVKEFQKAVRRTVRNKIHKKNRPRQTVELKGINTALKTKKYFLKQIKASAILNEEIEHESWFSEFLGEGPSGHFMRRGDTSPFVSKFLR